MTTVTSDTLTYECPHCHKTIRVDQHLFGEMVDCPKCKVPFEVVPPKAFPTRVVDSNPESTVQHAQLSDEEATELIIHPVVFRRHIVGTLFALLLLTAGIAGGWLALTGRELFGFGGLLIGIPAAICLLISCYFLAKWFIMSRMQSLTLTSERLIYRHGIIQRDTSEMRHDDVRNLKVEQNFLERLLNFGDVAISSAGQDDMEIVIHDIPNPQSIAEFVRKRQ